MSPMDFETMMAVQGHKHCVHCGALIWARDAGKHGRVCKECREKGLVDPTAPQR